VEAGDATRCLDCAYESQCPYSAKKSEWLPRYVRSSTRGKGVVPVTDSFRLWPVYLDRVSLGDTGWPVSPLVDGIPDIENVSDALVDGPYGKCVYESDNDVCDNQVKDPSISDGRALTARPHHTLAHTRTRTTNKNNIKTPKGGQPPIRIRRHRIFHDGRLHHPGL